MAPQVMTCRVALVNVYDDEVAYRSSNRFEGFEAGCRLVCTIGRNPDCDITIADPRLMVSRRHCSIVYDKGENSFLIQNTSGTNGTYLGSVEVRGEPARLCDGDLVTFGGPTTVVREGRSMRNPHKFRVRCAVEPVREEAPRVEGAGRERKRRRTEQAAGASERPEVYTVPTGTIENSLTCEICCDLFDTPVAVACGHVFCRGCIWRWNRRNNHCPKCRDPRGSVITGRLVQLDELIDFIKK